MTILNAKSFLIALLAVTTFSFSAQAVETPVAEEAVESNMMDELDPFDPNIEQKLEEMDAQYRNETGESSHLPNFGSFFNLTGKGCYKLSCSVYIQVDKNSQRAYLYVNGQQQAEWLVSTGTMGRGTPDFDTHPNGRVYDAYTSKKFPGGDYNGLGNMPYAVFISGGFAIHGTGTGNWKKLGSRASHGCIRLHPDNAYKFNRLVRQYGVRDTWITVQ